MSDIYDLIRQVKQHPDFVFGTIFTRGDFSDRDRHRVQKMSGDATEWLVMRGWEYLETMCEVRAINRQEADA